MRHVWVGLGVTVFGLLLGCEAVVGDVGSYTDSCSPLQDKCPKGNPCVYDFGASLFKCKPHPGTKGQDVPCATEDDCAPGYACSRFKNNNTGHCTRYCNDTSQCADGCKCYEFGMTRPLSTGGTVGACGPLDAPCDPVTNNGSGCPTGQRCTLYDTDYTKCDKLEETRAVNTACEYLEQCGEGTTCYGSNTNGYFCRQLCDYSAPNCPAASPKCVDYSPIRNLGDVRIGICVP